MKKKAKPAGLTRPAVSGACFFFLLASSFPCALSAQETSFSWQAEFTELIVEIDPVLGLMKGDARLQLNNPSTGSEDIQLDLSHQLDVESVSDEGGRPLPFERRACSLVIHRRGPPGAKGTVALRIQYQGSFHERIPELDLHHAWIDTRIAYAFYSSRWYPQPPAPQRRSRGRITYVVPRDWVVASSGTLTATETPPGAKRLVFTISTPVEFSFAAAAFTHQRERIAGLEMGVFLLGGGADKIRYYLENGAALVRYYRELYGFFPYEGFHIIEIPADLLGKASAGSYEGLTFFSSAIMPDRFFYTTVFAHEISHCWWGNCVRGAEGAVINEGLAQVSMGLYLEQVFGSGFLWNLLKNGSGEYFFLHSARMFFRALQSPRIQDRTLESLLFRGEDLELGKATAGKFATLHMLASSKGFFVYAMLRELIGPKAFRQGLRGALAAYAWKTMTLEDLRGQFERASGQDLKWFFDQWFLRKGAPEFSMACTVTPRHNKVWVVRGTISQLRDVYRVKAEIVAANRSFRDSKTIEIRSRETPFAFLLPFKPLSVRFDPDYKILRWSEQF
jgi:hypothetical protein